MNRSDNIQTFAVGLDITHNNYVQLAQKGGTKTPLYASNANDLLNKLTDAIKQAISGRLTFTTPQLCQMSLKVILFINQHLNMKKISNGREI
jgi:hypothetical protein